MYVYGITVGLLNIGKCQTMNILSLNELTKINFRTQNIDKIKRPNYLYIV